MIRYLLKSVVLAVCICGYILSSLILGFFTLDEDLKRRRLAGNICRWARVGSFVLGIRMQLRGEVLPDDVFAARNFLVVCNHLSYTDVMVLAAAFPAVFITSVEVRDSAFVGLMSALGGSVFIERRNRDNIDREIEEIAGALRAGLNVVIFPEATSTNGDTVLPFKRSLLKSAIDAKVNVLPLVISYPEVNGRVASKEDREMICYYGDKQFFSHLRQFMSLRSLQARVHFLPEMQISEMVDRKMIADLAHEQIHRIYTTEV